MLRRFLEGFSLTPLIALGLLIKINRDASGVKVAFDLFGRRFVFLSSKVPDIPTAGIGSLVDDGTQPLHHVIFLDFDNVNEQIVRRELELFSRFYGLPPFYLFATKRRKDKEGTEMEKFFGNYMGICLAKLPFADVYDLVRQSHCDYNYKMMPKFSRYKMWILRILPKNERPAPQFLDIVGEWDNLDREISRAHRDFLLEWYPDIPEIPYENVDDSDEVPLTPYVTGKE